MNLVMTRAGAHCLSVLFLGVFLDSPTEFTVDASSVTPSGEGNVRAIVNNPSGTKNDTTVTNKGDGTYDVLYTPVEEGGDTDSFCGFKIQQLKTFLQNKGNNSKQGKRKWTFTVLVFFLKKL